MLRGKKQTCIFLEVVDCNRSTGEKTMTRTDLLFPLMPIRQNCKLIAAFGFIFALLQTAASQVDSECHHPLGMQDKRVPDYHITATSQHAPGTGPTYARLGRDESDGAWCPKGLLEPNTENEYLQVRLRSSCLVTGIATQGRYSHGTGREFVRNYKLNYSRDGKEWFSWSNPNRKSILEGNTDTNTEKMQSLAPGLAGAEYVRFIPVASRAMPVCVRLELYGCLWNSGLVSYDMPTPDDYMGNHGEIAASRLSDDTYDGRRTSSFFVGGLGQLSDGVIGNDDITKSSSPDYNEVGYDYVAWSGKRNIIILFRFDEVRNFTSMTIHCSYDQNHGAALFSSIKVSYSLNGRSYSSVSDSGHLKFNTNSQGNDARSPFINLPLSDLIARALKIEFELRNGKLMISEVQFFNSLLPPETAAKYSREYPWAEEVENKENSVVTGDPETKGDGGVDIGIIVGILISVIVILIIIVVALYIRQKKLRKTLVPTYSYRAGTSRGEHMVTLTPRLPANGEVLESKVGMPVYQEIGPTATLPPDNLYLEPSDVIRRAPPPPYQSLQNGEAPALEVTVSLPPAESIDGGVGASNISHYAETDLLLPKLELEPIQGVTGNNIYAVPWTTPSPKRARRAKPKKSTTLPATLHGSSTPPDDVSAFLSNLNLGITDLPPEFPRDKLVFTEKLGEGQFGEVQLCRVDASIRTLEEDNQLSQPGPSESTVLVAVKVLRMNASANAKEDFFKEVRVMSQLLHPNIVRLLAVCTKDEPFAMVTEYMENGDLHEYLQMFDDDIKAVPGKKTIGNEALIKMAVQIASGMDYLASLKFIHRDLATRNCLVGPDYSIRIGDFGMSRNMYQSDYYRIQGKAILPIRWMSWECVLMGKFSSSSDVWSFGVTLWEIYSLCKYQPYALMNDQQVIENMHHMFRRTGEEVSIYLPRPKRCPASLFNMIRQCWKRSSEERPTFQQLHSYLMERQQTTKPCPRPKPPQIKAPVPAVRVKK